MTQTVLYSKSAKGDQAVLGEIPSREGRVGLEHRQP